MHGADINFVELCYLIIVRGSSELFFYLFLPLLLVAWDLLSLNIDCVEIAHAETAKKRMGKIQPTPNYFLLLFLRWLLLLLLILLLPSLHHLIFLNVEYFKEPIFLALEAGQC